MVFELSLERGGGWCSMEEEHRNLVGWGWDGIGGCRRLGRVECEWERVSVDV